MRFAEDYGMIDNFHPERLRPERRGAIQSCLWAQLVDDVARVTFHKPWLSPSR